MFDRTIEQTLLPVLEEEGIGCIAFCPLAQGVLTDKYLHGIPQDSRAGKPTGYLRPKDMTEEKIAKVRKLQEIAQRRGQSLAQMALAWTLRDKRVTSALIGASKVTQIEDNVAALDKLAFTDQELAEIEKIVPQGQGRYA
jgi:L-glyceraldehyde 3-phosphate reductase